MKWLVIALLGLSALLGLAWQGERLAHSQTQTLAAQKIGHEAELARQAEAERGKAQKELSDAATEHASRVDALLLEQRRAVVRHAADSERLRNEARAFANKPCHRPSGSAGDIEAGPSRALVLADLLGRADERAARLAHAADEARARGLACEADYERVVQRLNELSEVHPWP
jgi:hypothetical protein